MDAVLHEVTMRLGRTIEDVERDCEADLCDMKFDVLPPNKFDKACYLELYLPLNTLLEFKATRNLVLTQRFPHNPTTEEVDRLCERVANLLAQGVQEVGS